MSNLQMPNSRYVLPEFIEQNAQGSKTTNPYSKLFEERIIFLGTQVDDTSANDIMARSCWSSSLQDPDRDITMYINSPGGSFTALMAIYDTMRYVRPDIADRVPGPGCFRSCRPAGCRRAPGKRAALPNSRVLIHQPRTQGAQGQVSDLEIEANEIERMRRLMENTLAEHTGRTAEQVRIDTDRDKILTAHEAVEYGLIDTVFDYRKLNA